VNKNNKPKPINRDNKNKKFDYPNKAILTDPRRSFKNEVTK